MPKQVNVLAAGNSVTPKQIARIKAYLDTVRASKKPDSVVIVPGDKFRSVAKGGDIDTKWAFTNPEAGRTYINADVFNEKHPNEHYGGPDFPEFVLGHELSHMNDKTPYSAQAKEEDFDTKTGRANPYDAKSQDLLKKWHTDKGDAYSLLKQQAPGATSTVQPVETKPSGDLTPPNEYANTPYNLARDKRP